MKNRKREIVYLPKDIQYIKRKSYLQALDYYKIFERSLKGILHQIKYIKIILNRKVMEELLCKKSYYCKPIIGLKYCCKSILGFVNIQTSLSQDIATTSETLSLA